MQHGVQMRSCAARRGATALACVLVVLGCTQSGDVVIVLDSTMRGEAVEVVATSVDPRLARRDRPMSAAGADSLALLRTVDDEGARLAARFRALRDSLNREVRSLDSLDRRSRQYAVRYADIRRRTLGAEAIRAERDAYRARADSIRAMLGPDITGASDTATSEDGNGGNRRVLRETLADSSITLSLQPGRWWIGASVGGARPERYDTIVVRRGEIDTLRLTPLLSSPDASR
jgi:hypothetical protein